MALPKGTTTAETLSVNGVVLNTYAKNIESLTGRLTTPGKRTSNIVVPGRHGSLRQGGKKFDENVLALPMWVVGGTDDGKIPTGTTDRRLFFQNIDALSHLFLGTDGPLDIRHTLPDGSVRQCFADVLDAINFAMEGANPVAKFGVTLVVHDAFWQDLDAINQSQVANGTSVSLSSFGGATAPMEELTAHFIGPWTSPVVTFSDGSWLAYDGAIPAGQQLNVFSRLWALTGGGGFVPKLELLRYGGTSSRWISVPPTGPGAPVVVNVAGTSRTTATLFGLSGRRKYLVG